MPDGHAADKKLRSRQGSLRQVTATLGHSSILLAFVIALVGIVSADPRRAQRRTALSNRHPLRDPRPICSGHLGGGRADLRFDQHRLLDQVRRLQYHPGDADLLPRHRSVGRAGRIAAALGMDSDHLRRRRRVDLPRPPPRNAALGADDLFHRVGILSRCRRLSCRIRSKPCRRFRSTAAVSIRCSKTPT